MQQISTPDQSSYTCDSWGFREYSRRNTLQRTHSATKNPPSHQKSVSWPLWPDRMPKRFPIAPHENDVLLGRGGRNNQHSGNEKLRDLARQYCDEYKTSSKREKSELSRRLVRMMRQLDPPARFLRRTQQTSEWSEVGDDHAREKTSQVLRDAVTGLLEKKPSPQVPVATVSAPASTDEHDIVASTSETSIWFPSPGSGQAGRGTLDEVTTGVARLPSEDTSNDDISRSYSLSPRKRRRQQGASVSASHSFDERSQSSSSSPAVDYSPIRRYHSAGPRTRQRHAAEVTSVGYTDVAIPPVQSNPPRVQTQHGHNRNVGSDYLGQLMQGELLESDDDAEIPLLPRSA